MNVKVEKTEKNVVQLEIEVDAAKFAEAMQKSYLKNVKKYNIPGFRKGKAPRNIVERYYGEQVFYEEAINIICADTYDAAIEENDIHPVDRPDIDIKQIGSGQNLIYTAKVTVRPEVELGEYKGVEISKTEVNITDEDVQKELDIVVEKNARIISIDDRAVASGDIAVIDFEGFVDEVAFEGGKGENYSLEIGSGQFIPGFEDQLIGAEIGDTVDVNVAFPEDYIKQDLAGKPALFKVRIKEIKFKELPVVDDEFAKDVSEFDTIDEYKADLKKKLTEKAEHEAEHKLEDDVLAKVVDNAKIDIPRVMIEKQIDRLVYDFERRIQYQGMNLQMYMEYTGMDVDTFRGQFEVKAELDVRNQLVLEKVSQVENVDATQDEIDEEVDKVAASYTGNNAEALVDFKKHLREDDIEYIKRTIIVRKTIKLLVENAKIA